MKISYETLAVAAAAAMSFVAVNWAYFKILKIAKAKDLVDNPDARKLQKCPVPVMGGIAVFIGVVSGILTGLAIQHSAAIPITPRLLPIVCGMVIMLYTGAMDDIIGLTPQSRIVIEILTMLGLIFGSGNCIDTFHGMWGINNFSWWLAVPLSVFAGVGIINAINMIDGVNGLSSGLCITCCIFFGTEFIKANDLPNTVLAFSMAAALFPFMVHNVFGLRSRMFIGDAGTMVMGILVSWFVMCTLSHDTPVRYYADASGVNLIALSLAILSVPVFDTLRVMSMRIAHGKSPFHPDKTHLHHVFVGIGISHSITSLSEILIDMLVVLIWGLSVVFGASVEWQLYIVILSAVIFVWGTYAFLRYQLMHDTKFLHELTSWSIKTHLGRTEWWQRLTSLLDAPEDKM